MMLRPGVKRKTLVAYNDSSNDSDSDSSMGSSEDPAKEKKLRLPASVLKMFKESEQETSGKDTDTKGPKRIRSFDHFEGNWASFVYIPVQMSDSLRKIILKMTKKLSTTFEGIHPMPMNELHISVSQTVTLRHYWIEPISEKLRKAFSNIERFTCYLDLVEVYTNDEKTRTFVGIRILVGEEQIRKLVSEVDMIFKEFGLQKYYENPRFHVSFAWTLFDASNDFEKATVASLQEIFDESFEDDSNWRKITVKELCIKTGNKTFQMPLKSTQSVK